MDRYILLLDIPLVICGNKNDMCPRVKTHIYKEYTYFQISCKVRRDCLQLLNYLKSTINCYKETERIQSIEDDIPCPYGLSGVECDCEYHSPYLYKN